MEQNRFDAVTKLFGDRSLSRRRALTRGAVALAAGTMAGVGGSSLAEDVPVEAPPDTRRKHPLMMFVQTFLRGSIARTAGYEDRYTVTLEQGVGQTIYFSDRPDRIVGVSPTGPFLEGLGFLEDNPPNAALILETAPEEVDIAVVELFTPVYDPVGSGVTYDVEVLANWQQSLEMGFTEATTDLAEIAPTFGAAQLFIDDCPDYKILCYFGNSGNRQLMASLGPQDHCYSWENFMCLPCDNGGFTWQTEIMAHWDAKCNAEVPACQDNCRAVSR